MVKESKSAVTIRRRRLRSPGDPVFQHKSHHSDEQCDFNDEDPEEVLEVPSLAPPVLKLIMSSEKTFFMGLLAFRCMNALMIQTAYVPDEYWQSTEVAHNMAFGYGYMTWEWHQGLRGYAYPLLFASVFKVLGIFHLDSRILLIKIPRLLQALFAAFGDLYLYKLSAKLSGHQVAQWSLLCQLTSWFTFYCSTRTLTNSMETVLTTMALYYYPWPGKARKAHWKYVTLVGLAVVVRPTAAIVWLPLCAAHIWMYRAVAWRIVKLFAERGFIILSLSSIVDRVFYGKWVNVHYNFLQFNVLSNMGAFYGSHPWHWYLSQGFAVIMGTHIFPFLLAVRRGQEKIFIGVIFWTVFVYSCLEHKEFRFIMPVLPMAMYVCGSYLNWVCSGQEEDEEEVQNVVHGVQNVYVIKDSSRSCLPAERHRRKLFIFVFLLVTNLPLALYTSLLHQRGTVDVMKFIHDQSFNPTNESIDALFLMPCHSTPYYSYLHRNVSARFLTCEPDLSGHVDYVDEADVFYQDPSKWLKRELASREQQVPTHLIMFNSLQPSISEELESYRYQECARFFHTHVPDGRVGTHVVVQCWLPWQEQWHKHNWKGKKKRKSF